MASRRPTSLAPDDGFPASHDFSKQNPPTSPSVISSRLSDDGVAPSGKSVGGASRPDTGDTVTSAKSKSTLKNRISGAPARPESFANPSQPPARTRNRMSQSHVPSLTSNAFFRPMSSQKLQAHRGGSRPVTMIGQQKQQQQQQQQQQQRQSQHLNLDDAVTDIGGSVMRRSTSSNRPGGATAQSPGGYDEHLQPPPSRGTEMTEQDRVTANTSPTGGHYPTGSLTDSVRPLNKNSDANRNGLRVNVDKNYQGVSGNIPSPVKSPRSFRSSFLLSGRESSQGQIRNTEGAEKLSSGASSPKFHQMDSQGHPRHHTAPREQQNKEAGRVYQYFEGNTNFCLGGRWQNTKGRPINLATGLFIVVPCVLFFVFSAPWLWHNVSPAIPITFAYLAFVCMSSFIHASVTDPGILPRNLHQFPPLDMNDDPLRLGPPTNDWTLVKSAESNTAAMEVPVKHCRTCNIWRPPRAHHCRLCDNCVEGHDHHCVWLNNCVGKRNYRYFFAFVTSGTILSMYVVATSLTQILLYQRRQEITFGDAMGHFRVPFALLILGFLTFCYPAALMGYHVFLMARGETTREYMNSHKFLKKERFRAYSQGSIWKNFAAVLCRPRPPTYYRFKTKYRPGDQRLGVRRDLRPKENAQGMEMQNVAAAPAQFQGPVALRGENNA